MDIVVEYDNIDLDDQEEELDNLPEILEDEREWDEQSDSPRRVG